MCYKKNRFCCFNTPVITNLSLFCCKTTISPLRHVIKRNIGSTIPLCFVCVSLCHRNFLLCCFIFLAVSILSVSVFPRKNSFSKIFSIAASPNYQYKVFFLPNRLISLPKRILLQSYYSRYDEFMIFLLFNFSVLLMKHHFNYVIHLFYGYAFYYCKNYCLCFFYFLTFEIQFQTSKLFIKIV